MLFGKGKRGSLFKSYENLKPEEIIKELNLEPWNPKQIVYIIYKLAIYGGLDLQNTLWEQGVFKSADQDSIFIEGTAYTWENIRFSVISNHDLPLHNEDIIIQGMHVGSGVLAEILSSHSKITIDDNFSNSYRGISRQKASEILNEKLLSIKTSEATDPLKEQISTVMMIGIFEQATQKGITDSVKAILTLYLENKS